MTGLHVICKIGGVDYAIPATDVFQMESYSPLTKVPGAPSYLAGLIQVRQHVVPVVDARVRFGLPPVAPSDDSRFVILKLGERLIGMLVDSAREVRNFVADEFGPPPDVIANQHGFVKAIAQLKDRIVMLIDAIKVVGEENAHG